MCNLPNIAKDKQQQFEHKLQQSILRGAVIFQTTAEMSFKKAGDALN